MKSDEYGFALYARYEHIDSTENLIAEVF